MLHLKKYTWNVYEICKNNPDCPDLGVGYDMLRNNIKWGRAIDPGTDLPWAKLSDQWAAMSAQEQKASRAEYRESYQRKGLAEAFQAGDRTRFEAILYPPEAPEAAGEQEESGQA